MFWRNFRYTLKLIFHNKSMIFWSFAFPLILGTFFSLAFSNLDDNTKLKLINIAVVDNADFQNHQIFRESIQNLSNPENPDQLFQTNYVPEDTAKELLANSTISGYLLLEGDQTKVIVNSSDINSTILKFTAEHIAEQNTIITALLAKNTPAALHALATLGNEAIGGARVVDETDTNASSVVIYFYTLIAMACLYGSFISLIAIAILLPNMTTSGKRIAISPAPKSQLLFSTALASYVAQIIGLALLFLYCIFILHIDFGANLPLIILTSLLGCLVGLVLGTALSTLFKTSENFKVSIITATVLLGCFLAGMMSVEIKYIIDTNLPIINQINPANLITDSFYSLYRYGSLDRYWSNSLGLLICFVILVSISIFSLRRQKYDHL